MACLFLQLTIRELHILSVQKKKVPVVEVLWKISSQVAYCASTLVKAVFKAL